jgi:hypothetical protein
MAVLQAVERFDTPKNGWLKRLLVPSRMITFPLGDQRFSWQDRF